MARQSARFLMLLSVLWNGLSNPAKASEPSFWQKFFETTTHFDRNQAAFLQSASQVGTVYFNQNLEKIYATEIESIEKQWKAISQVELGKTELKSTRSEFFSQAIAKLNRQGVFSQLATLDSVLRNKKAMTISSEEIGRLWAHIEKHPVIGTESINQYDPQLGIGFCFARALVAHKILIDRRAKAEHVFKVFAVGQMNYEGVFWRFHVATVVWTEKGFLPVDILVEKNSNMTHWFKQVDKVALNPKRPQIRYYLARASVFDSMDGLYNKQKIFNPYLKPLFEALTGTF